MNEAPAATIPLQHPKTIDGDTIKEISLRRPTVLDQLKAQGDDPPGTPIVEIRLMARLTGLPEKTIEQLDLADYMEASRTIAGFLSRRMPPSSGASS